LVRHAGKRMVAGKFKSIIIDIYGRPRNVNEMPILSDIIEQSDMPGSANIYLRRSMKLEIFLPSGYGLTITKDPTWHWEELRQCRN